jgi:hypothetical protein
MVKLWPGFRPPARAIAASGTAMPEIFQIVAVPQAGAERLHSPGVDRESALPPCADPQGSLEAATLGKSDGAGRCMACILGCDGPSAHAAAAAQEIELSLGLHALRLTDDLIRI